MSTHRLFTPYKLGTIELKNRVVMSPMTRSRAAENIPNDLMAEYYSQRAGAGLIITEGTSPSPNGLGYARIPGIFSEEQVAGWKKITDAVHKKGGRIFVQIMHTGRVGHPVNLPAGAELLGVSAIGVKGTVWTDSEGNKEYGVPREMNRSEVQKTIQEYVKSSENAIRAGFDGVELHGANGYMIDQFLNPASNHRTDEYGGSADNRNRFAIEVATAVVKAIGAEKVGIRISPYGVFNDMQSFEGLEGQYEELAKAFGKVGLVYVHIVDHSSMGAPKPEPSTIRKIREAYKVGNATGTFILSGGYDLARSETDLSRGEGDLIAFGRPYISNPDLADRLEKGLSLSEPDSATFYTPGEKGYTDYAYVAK
ncbi:oxidoreductase, FAD/FMN dependent [Leptospira inadai serovar Lyme str. 10]|uniref:Oxidoreductase, FAD/FMN dependent n=2 Tax=Leptospira inadai serovar Lyme TaxID=293084 RepID=V6HA49_9LEPT|nr:alkene reductase [Leptospira inadai]EQA35183.1 oxidoreductase, FAD/FMN dependent [Leptospira inadai serovar Lyme str. 10]PNV74152.1 alkene reductase [Leptospira inadai serovar Lyme]